MLEGSVVINRFNQDIRQIHSALGKEVKACVRKVKIFDDEMGEFGHTPSGRDAFDPLRRRKCSKLLAVPCAFLLTVGQNRLRLDKFCL
jgi:hypothetical protein